VRLGGADAQPTRLEVLGALPAAEEDPLVVLLEVEDGAATFMLTTAMATLGDGTCAPAPEDCQTLTLRPGEVQFLEVPAADGTVVQHELEVVSVREADEGGDTGDAEDEESIDAVGAKAGAARAATGPVRLDLATARGVREDVARLAALPTTEDARVLFLGPRAGGRAAFLNVTGAPVRTTGRCRPSAQTCRVVELRAREVAVVDGDVVLAVRGLRGRTAADALQRTSPAGRALARDLAVAGLLGAADLAAG
jgi:hypothetical protein